MYGQTKLLGYTCERKGRSIRYLDYHFEGRPHEFDPHAGVNGTEHALVDRDGNPVTELTEADRLALIKHVEGLMEEAIEAYAATLPSGDDDDY